MRKLLFGMIILPPPPSNKWLLKNPKKKTDLWFLKKMLERNRATIILHLLVFSPHLDPASIPVIMILRWLGCFHFEAVCFCYVIVRLKPFTVNHWKLFVDQILMMLFVSFKPVIFLLLKGPCFSIFNFLNRLLIVCCLLELPGINSGS